VLPACWSERATLDGFAVAPATPMLLLRPASGAMQGVGPAETDALPRMRCCACCAGAQGMQVVGILSDETDPMVSVMKVEKAPQESYADVGGLEQQIQVCCPHLSTPCVPWDGFQAVLLVCCQCHHTSAQ
jgi:hypothetical protein